MKLENSLQYILLLWLIIMIILGMCGCTALQSKPLPKSGTELLTKTVLQTNWLMTFSIIGVGAGFFAFLNGNSRGLNIMASCFVVLSLVLCIAKFAVWIAAITMAGAVGLMAFTIITRKMALKDVVETVEYAKNIMNSEEKEKWNRHKSLIKKSVQHPLTTKLVKHIKKQLK